jgi:hypothetical protein
MTYQNEEKESIPRGGGDVSGKSATPAPRGGGDVSGKSIQTDESDEASGDPRSKEMHKER